MITLITGTPGSGKTLRCVELLAELRDSDDPKTRSRVIFSNINDLAPEIGAVSAFDPLRWMDLPEGSLIVVDECQDFWPSRPSGSKRPESVSALNTHRHRGVDLILLTQHPGLIDQDIRSLVGRHLHAYRPRGHEYSVWYEWSYCEAHCQPKLSPIPEKRSFNKKIFLLYKSTVENTHKPQSLRPLLKKLLFPAVAIVGGISLVTWSFLGMARSAEPEKPLYQDAATPAKSAPSLPSLTLRSTVTYQGKSDHLLCPDTGPCLHWSSAIWKEEGGEIILTDRVTQYRITDPLTVRSLLESPR